MTDSIVCNEMYECCLHLHKQLFTIKLHCERGDRQEGILVPFLFPSICSNNNSDGDAYSILCRECSHHGTTHRANLCMHDGLYSIKLGTVPEAWIGVQALVSRLEQWIHRERKFSNSSFNLIEQHAL